MEDQYKLQEESEAQAERIRDARRRAGELPKTPGSLAFQWADLIETVANDMGMGHNLVLITMVKELIEDNPGVGNAIEHQINEMNDALRKNRIGLTSG